MEELELWCTKFYVIPTIIFSTTYTMPRILLQSTSPNRTNREELQPFQRGINVGRFLEGQKKSNVQHEMKLPYTIIQTIITTYQSSTTGTSSPRIGRLGILSDADKCYILLQIERDPFIKTEGIYS